jgi:chromosome segregation ATPase
MEDEMNVNELRIGFATATSIPETILLFNDFLVQKQESPPDAPVQKGARTLSAENKQLKKENERLLAERDDIRRTIATLTTQDSAERAVGELSGQLRERRSPDQLTELEREKERLAKSLAALKSRVNVQDQITAATEELQTQLKHIHRQYRIVKKVIDGIPHPEKYPDGDEIADLESALKTAKEENSLLREQITQLQHQIATQHNATRQKDQQIDRLVAKLRGIKQKNADSASDANRQQNEIAELRLLYNQATEQMDSLTQGRAEVAG